MTTESTLPDYDPLQHSFHEAFEPELTAILHELDLRPNSRVLDIPCGDGFYSRRLARRLGEKGRVVGVDQDKAYLNQARNQTSEEAITFRQGDVYALACKDECFDWALSAMSFISIKDPVLALTEVFRVLVPGGGVAVLETDEHHHILLNWPIDVEMAVQRAIRDTCGGRYSPARKVNRMLREASFVDPRKKTFAADRQAPFSSKVNCFLTRYLTFLRNLVNPYLSERELAAFDRYADPGDEKSLFQREDAELTCLMTLHQARRQA